MPVSWLSDLPTLVDNLLVLGGTIAPRNSIDCDINGEASRKFDLSSLYCTLGWQKPILWKIMVSRRRCQKYFCIFFRVFSRSWPIENDFTYLYYTMWFVWEFKRSKKNIIISITPSIKSMLLEQNKNGNILWNLRLFLPRFNLPSYQYRSFLSFEFLLDPSEDRSRSVISAERSIESSDRMIHRRAEEFSAKLATTKR